MEINTESGSIGSDQVELPQIHRVISGFWRRLLALILDSFVLGLVGVILGLFLFDFFSQLGGWGRLFGFCIALIYFGLLNSTIGKGQTIGKRIMRIEVVDRVGNNISIGRSFLRYTVLGAPFFLNQLMISPTVLISVIGYIIGIIIFGFGGAIVYLYIFNRRTRQSLHDLATGTFVVKTLPKGEISPVSIWRLHLIAIASWFFIVIGVSLVIPHFAQKGIFPELITIVQSIHSSGKVHMATVFVGKSWRITGEEKWENTYIHSNAIWKGQPDNYEIAAGEIASIILNEYSDVLNKDVLGITVTYGYDIGIASAWKRQYIQHSPQEWQEILGKNEDSP